MKSGTKRNNYPVGHKIGKLSVIIDLRSHGRHHIVANCWQIGELLRLGRHIARFFCLIFEIVLIFSLKFDGRTENSTTIVLLETLSAVLVLECIDYVPNVLIFPKKPLILAAALHGAPCSDEKGHLFKNLTGSEIK